MVIECKQEVRRSPGAGVPSHPERTRTSVFVQKPRCRDLVETMGHAVITAHEKAQQDRVADPPHWQKVLAIGSENLSRQGRGGTFISQCHEEVAWSIDGHSLKVRSVCPDWSITTGHSRPPWA